MTMLFFADANVLLYTRDQRASDKRLQAITWTEELARRGLLVVNLQVLNEVCHAALRKLHDVSPDEVRRWVDQLAIFGAAPLDADIVKAAWAVRLRYRLAWFDCLIVASAGSLGCTHLLTEDMGAPRKLGRIALVNPFRASPRDVLSES